MQTYKNKKIAIVGLSVEGLDSVGFFLSEGAIITCLDRRTNFELGETFTKLMSLGVAFQLGDSYLSNLDQFDLIVRTPGISSQMPDFAQHKNKLTSQTKLFFDLCAGATIGVTGTKGKGTTASLIAAMLVASGKKTYLGGNVGTPLLSKVRSISDNDSVVLELSSFQLEDLTQSPHITVVLPITQDHLANFDPLATNYHENLRAYVAAKSSIVRFQTRNDFLIVNADNETSASFARESKAIKYFVSRKIQTDAYVEHAAVFVKWQGTAHKICSKDEVILRGEHNLENIAAASIAALVAGCSFEAIRKASLEFKGLPHRLEFVGKINGISFYDDSFSTVPETTIAAVKSFDNPIILIVGGSEKRSDFTQMGRVIEQSQVKVLIAIGQMTGRIVDCVKNAGFTRKIITGLTTMKQIVRAATKLAKPRDVVLLSPACASFDMFKNYKERGDQFAHEVSLLALEATK